MIGQVLESAVDLAQFVGVVIAAEPNPSLSFEWSHVLQDLTLDLGVGIFERGGLVSAWPFGCLR